MKDNSTQKASVGHTVSNDTMGKAAASKENQEHIKKQNDKNIQIAFIGGLFSLLTTVITAYIGYIVSTHSNTLENLRKDIERPNLHNQNFAREMESSLNNISGGNEQSKAKMEMIRLYTFTMSESDTSTAIKDKCVLLNLADASQNESLKETITNLISPQDLINSNGNEYCRAAMALARGSFGPELSKGVDHLSSKSETELLKKVSQVGNQEKKGWIYIGEENDLNKKLELDNRIEPSAVYMPLKDNFTGKRKIKTTRDVLLRDSSPYPSSPGKYTLGKVITVIGSGTTLEVVDSPVKVPVDSTHNAVWIHVQSYQQAPEKNSGAKARKA